MYSCIHKLFKIFKKILLLKKSYYLKLRIKKSFSALRYNLFVDGNMTKTQKFF